MLLDSSSSDESCFLVVDDSSSSSSLVLAVFVFMLADVRVVVDRDDEVSDDSDGETVRDLLTNVEVCTAVENTDGLVSTTSAFCFSDLLLNFENEEFY